MNWYTLSDGNDYRVVDGDTIADREGNGYRVHGIDTYEVEHGEGMGTHQGDFQRQILENLIRDKGFTGIEFTGDKDTRRDDGPRRPLINLTNPSNNKSAVGTMYYHGLALPRGGFFKDEDMQLWKQGLLARKTNPEAGDPYYKDLRKQFKEVGLEDRKFLKEKAFTEAHFRPEFHSGVKVRHFDRNMHNEANSAFKSSFAGGLDSMQSGLFGVLEMLGNRASSETAEREGAAGVRWNQFQQEQLPTWVGRVEEVDSISKAANWMAGALGGSLPYFGLMATGFIPGMQVPVFSSMSLIYAGQTWNEMEGLPDEKSMVVGLSSGILQSYFERLGGKIVFGKWSKPSMLATDKGIKAAVIALTKTQRDEVTGRFTHKKLTTKEARELLNRAKSEEIAKTLKDFSNNSAVWKAYGAMVAKQAGAGFLGEATTETMQEATQNIGAWLGSPESKRKFDPADFKSAMLNAFAAGGLLGGALRGGSTALTAPSPLKTSVRDYRWGEDKNSQYDTTNPVSIEGVLSEAKTRFAPNDTPRNRKEFSERAKQLMEEKNISIKEANKLVDKEEKKKVSKVEKADRKVAKMIDKHVKDEKEVSIAGKTGEAITKLKFLSTPMQVLSSKMGEAYFHSDTLIALGDFFGSPTGKRAHGQTHVQRKFTMRGGQHDRLNQALDTLTDRLGLAGHSARSRNKAYNLLSEYIALNSHLHPKAKDSELKYPKGAPHNREAFKEALNLIRGYERYQGELVNGIDKNYVALDFSTFENRTLKVSAVKKQKEKFIHALMSDNPEMSREEAEQEFNDILNAPENYDAREYVNTRLTTKKPSHLKRKRSYNNEVFKDFWDKNSYTTAMVRNSEIANYVSDMEAVGWGGKGLNSMILAIEQELNEYYRAAGLSKKEAKAEADRWMPYIAHEMYRHYQLHRGDYKRFKDKYVQHAAANMGAIMSLAYMGLAVFSSFAEGGLAFRDATGTTKDGERVFFKSLKNLAKLTGQSMVSQMKKVARIESKGKLTDTDFRDGLVRKQTARGMTSVETGSGHVIDAEVNVDRKTWLQREVMPRFYRLTGLTSFTTAMRMIRDSFALDWIAIQLDNVLRAVEQEAMDPNYLMNNREARSFSKLKEVGTDPRGIAKEYNILQDEYAREKKMKNRVEYSRGRAYNRSKDFFSWLDNVVENKNDPLNDIAVRLAGQLETARANFIDAALVNPDPSKRPAFYSDGRLRLLTIFQGYLSVFSAKIARPLLRDLAGKGSPADQMNAAAVLMTMLALAYLGQAFKDEIKYGDRPVWLSDAEYLERGFLASGIMGQNERIFQLFFPMYSSEEDSLADRAWAEIGPLTGTFDALMKGTDWALQGEKEKALNQFLKVAPGGVFTGTRGWTAEQLSRILGD